METTLEQVRDGLRAARYITTPRVETALFLSKTTTRKGTVEEGNTVTDFEPDERDRRQSILAKVVHLPWQGATVQLIDTPGSQDFAGEPAAAISASLR